MDDWTGWAAAILAFLLSLIGVNHQRDKKRFEDAANDLAMRQTIMSERLARVETELMTEREVRAVLKDYFDPFMSNMTSMQKDVQDIKVNIASLPKRTGDT